MSWKTMVPSFESDTSLRLSVVFLALCNFLVTFDITAIVVAMPTMREEMSLSVSGFAWVMDAYSLTFTVLLTSAGALADRFGRRAVLIAGLLAFAVGSVVCAGAATPPWLWTGRVLQGLGAAFVICGCLALLAVLFPQRETRLKAFAFAGAISGGAMALGPAIGGFVTDHLGWRWVFWINLPIVMVVMIGILSTIRRDQITTGQGRKIDVAGVLTLTLFLSVTIWMLLHGPTIGSIELPTYFAYILPALTLAMFLVSQKVQSEPIFGLALFKTRAFIGMCAVPLGLSMGYWAMLVYLPLFLRDAIGYSTGGVSLAMLAVTLPMVFLPFVGRRFAAGLGDGLFFVGGLIGLAGGCAIITLGAILGIPSLAIGGMFLSGCSTAAVNAQVSGAIVTLAPPDRAGLASAIATTLRQGGFAVGIAFLGAALGGKHTGGEALTSFDFAPAFALAGLGAFLAAIAVGLLVGVATPRPQPSH